MCAPYWLQCQYCPVPTAVNHVNFPICVWQDAVSQLRFVQGIFSAVRHCTTRAVSRWRTRGPPGPGIPGPHDPPVHGHGGGRAPHGARSPRRAALRPAHVLERPRQSQRSRLRGPLPHGRERLDTDLRGAVLPIRWVEPPQRLRIAAFRRATLPIQPATHLHRKGPIPMMSRNFKLVASGALAMAAACGARSAAAQPEPPKTLAPQPPPAAAAASATATPPPPRPHLPLPRHQPPPRRPRPLLLRPPQTSTGTTVSSSGPSSTAT